MQTIRTMRQQRGWSQFELALRVGVPLPVLRGWESGQAPPLPQLRRLAGVFDAPIGLDPVGDPAGRGSPHLDHAHAAERAAEP
jgi:transcriptional regulator with XRE-family HTH domain